MYSIDQWQAMGQMHLLARHNIFVVDSDPSGAKPAILLIHGFPTSSWDWAPIWDQLTGDYRLVAMDLVGFGFSDKPRDHTYAIMEQADICEALVSELKLTSYHVLAHDYGDTVAQELLARENARPAKEQQWRSLCLLNGGLFPETHHARAVQKLLLSPLGPVISRIMGKASFDKSFSAVFGPESQPSADELASFWALINHNGGKILFHKLITYMSDRKKHRERWVQALIDACCPIQLINGSVDPVSGAHMVARYREVVRANDAITELRTIGHYPQVEDPEGVIAAYKPFVAACAAK